MESAQENLSRLSKAELEAHLTCLCREYSTAEYRLLACIRECERRGGELSHGMKSTAHWLHARFGIALGAAREKVRVARALDALPAVSDALADGRISYSKVRAITRIATPANESDLLRMAATSTASDMERVATEYRQLEHLKDPNWPSIQHRMRRLGWYWDDEGMLMVEGRLPPEDGAMFIRMIEAVRDLQYRAERSAARATEAVGEDSSEVREEPDPSPLTPPERRVDALLKIMKAGSDSDGEGPVLTGADRIQVMLHVVVDEGNERGERDDQAKPAHEPSVPRLEPGPVIAPAVARRLSCDAARIMMIENAAGEPLSVGRMSRAVGTYAGRWRNAMAAAAFRVVPSNATWTPTTSCTGPMAERPPWRTAACIMPSPSPAGARRRLCLRERRRKDPPLRSGRRSPDGCGHTGCRGVVASEPRRFRGNV